MLALYGKKIGMSQIFDANGLLVPVTILHIEPNVVIGNRSVEKNGYSSAVLAAFKKPSKQKGKEKIFSKPHLGLFKDNIEPRKKIFEVRGFEDEEVGKEFGVEIFESTTFVDITGVSKGKGFQGVMRRHGAHGGPARVGSKFHRTAGSTGHSSNPSRVRKGTNMAGRMGSDKVTTQNLQVMSVRKEDGVLVIKGAVPGANGGLVLIREAKKKGI